ncbi:MAG: competence/damage-inducible protein A [Niameybacter sp.]|uniref:competence/damage-inducible protein A n=1 Tax=Niameybacter sp. TaxID=2033640 RepID=UPI002FC64CA7
MKAEILAVGNEVVTGHTINTNASFIASRLQDYGVLTAYHTAVGDVKEDIEEALHYALRRVEIVFVIGGLGPTEDDLTKQVVCQALNKPLVFYEDVYQGIVDYFKRTNRTTPENNKRQAYFPTDAHILENTCGTAPGCLIKYEGKMIVLLPGPPHELIAMFNGQVCPYLEKQMEGVFYTVDVKCFGIGESHLAEQIGDLLGTFEDVVVAPYVGKLEIILRIRAYKKNYEEAYARGEEIKNSIVSRLKPYVIGYNEEEIEESILKILQKKRWTVSTAESCTGGLLAGTLVNCSGISSYFKEGVVTYSNEAKMKYLGVQEATLDQYGAVSHQTAHEMAEGIRHMAGVHIGLSTTGIAGPDGGTLEKPVGLVYIGIALPEETFTYELRLEGSRQEVRNKAVKHILCRLFEKLQN